MARYFFSRGETSLDSLTARNNSACADICRLIVSVEEKHSQRRSFNFSFLLFYIEENQIRFVESSDSEVNSELSLVPSKYCMSSLLHTFRKGVL